MAREFFLTALFDRNSPYKPALQFRPHEIETPRRALDQQEPRNLRLAAVAQAVHNPGRHQIDRIATAHHNARLLALRQPLARDLREILSSLKISSDLERICDYAANVAKRSITLSQTPVARPIQALPHMARIAQKQI